MKYLFIAKGNDDPAARYRVLPLATHLETGGCRAAVIDSDPGFADKFRVLARASAQDLVFIQRKLFSPFYTARLRRASKYLVYDFDDAIFLRSSGEPSVSRSRRFAAICGSADLVLAGNRYLCDEAAKWNDAVCHIPTPVDARQYEVDVDKDERFSLVWIGSSSTRRYLEQHRPLLEAIGRRLPNVVLKVISDFDFALDNLEVINVGWSSEIEAGAIKASHVGIAPMEDNPWTRGKCALKVIQYMAAGLPVVSSPVGANREVVADGETGMLAGSVADWCDAIASLSGDPDLARRMGAAGHRRFLAYYSVDAVRRRILDAFTEFSAPLEDSPV